MPLCEHDRFYGSVYVVKKDDNTGPNSRKPENKKYK
jgi:hypothetical protein